MRDPRNTTAVIILGLVVLTIWALALLLTQRTN